MFPAAEALANAALQGLPRPRAHAIRSLAQAVASGRVALSGSEEDPLANLAQIRGIGEWTVQYIAMRALRQPDAFPANDLVLLTTAGEGSALTVTESRKRAERWRPWRAYAAVYLWRAAADLAREGGERDPLRAAPYPFRPTFDRRGGSRFSGVRGNRGRRLGCDRASSSSREF